MQQLCTNHRQQPPGAVLLVTPEDATYRRAHDTADRVRHALVRAAVAVDTVDQGRQYDLAIAIGGDGTMMHAITKLSLRSIPTLGVNAGQVGFLTSAEATNWQQVVDHVTAGAYQLEDRLGLLAEISDFSIGPIANEVVVRHLSSVATLAVASGGQIFYQGLQGDGVLVATATGSTGYNTSANGPIILPGSGNVVITPLNPLSLATRPIVSHDVIEGRDITITLVDSKRNEPVMVITDGAVSGHRLAVGESIVLRQYPQPLRFATFGTAQYAQALVEKKGFAR